MSASFTDLRPSLIDALATDVIGPYATEERLRLPPSRWYLTGFLVPKVVRDSDEHDPTDDDELGAGNDETEEETGGAEPEPKQRNRLPASMGLSVLLPGGAAGDVVTATLTFADYVLEEREVEGGKRKQRTWKRVARGPLHVEVPLDPKQVAAGVRLAQVPGVVLKGKLALAEAPGLPRGTRALSLFVVNERPEGEKGRHDEQFLFQVELTLTFAAGFLARPNQRDGASTEWDERVADLQFRDRAEYAVGHGVSVEAPAPDASGAVTVVRTTWIPSAEVRRVVTFEDVAATVAMEDLAQLADGDAARAALTPICDAYGAWLDEQRRIPLTGGRADTRDQLVAEAEKARGRILAGIELVASDPEVLEAFRLANRAMATAARRRSPGDYQGDRRPRWRLFQLAFVLLNLPSIARDDSPDRDTVELIFFPTGGGKTEAYLGVIAFTLLLRRLRGMARPDQGLGVAIILRYTLRLLTLDQLGRAATLICALEMIRREQPVRLGDVRFAVGLWVGKSATANTMKDVSEKLTEYKTSSAKNPASPFPLTHCPWCEGKAKLGPASFTLKPTKKDPTDVVVGCLDPSCDFNPNHNPEGIPVLFVDEQIYRELPGFLIATVDKFAMLPMRGETGMLFGRALARRGRGFLGPLDDKELGAERLPDGLRPPELIVQDELHLISGPLGTMVGLYESAVEALCTRHDPGGRRVRPKILASTATVRRARDQIQALMGRQTTALFPPPGPNDSETFFATVDRTGPGRRYVGVAAPGRAMKAILLRAYVALLAAAQRLYQTGERDAVDAYMTLAGYFNSLRELGGMRRLVEDDVRVRCAQADERRPLDSPAPHRHLAARALQKEPVELTSREKTARIAESKARLTRPHGDPEHVDVLLASNMISVGVDIDRLGLMVVAGQPKTTAEYIQASSRVGRQARWPGLVVTCFNLHKPRDRSHYEQFTAYHESFYRFVEVTSLTPFSGPALDRGMVGALVAIARQLQPALAPPTAAMNVEKHRAIADEAVASLARRAGLQPGIDGATHDRVVDAITRRGQNLVDAWISIVTQSRKEAGKRSYSPYDRGRDAGKPILFTPLDEDKPPEGTDEAKFAAATSMRDVEPNVHLWLERRHLGGKR
ncbi:MAG: DISARM system helicase DrmA [Kofleriaceae bacterium]